MIDFKRIQIIKDRIAVNHYNTDDYILRDMNFLLEQIDELEKKWRVAKDDASRLRYPDMTGK